jgi:BirA family transcriptional regulator, biotin operon repressor / biotin---[acetyl-CoA-carboxylase] ligase
VSAAASSRPAAGRLSLASLGRPRLHLRETDSTNDRARELAIAGAPHGTLVTASFQTAGRGRHGRRWSAPPGRSLLASLILRSPPPLLPLIAAIAVCDIAGEEARIKWPNDIVLVRPGKARRLSPTRADAGGRGSATPAPILAKLAGILAEGRPQEDWAVLGIGLNVAVALDELPAELTLTAATLGQPPEEIDPTLARLLAALTRRLGEPAERTLRAWRARDVLHGRQIAWGAHSPTERVERGRAEGIDGAGRLIVARPAGGRITLDAGEVQLQDIG